MTTGEIKTLSFAEGTQVNAPSALGGGTGEKNYCTSPNDASGWIAGTGMTITTETSAANLPRASTTQSGIKFSSSTDEAPGKFRFTIDAADKGKKLKIQVDQKALGSFAAGDCRVEMWTNSQSDYAGTWTELPLSTDASGDSALPAATGTYRTTFDTTTADYYELRVVRNVGTAGTIELVLSDVVIGPGSAVQGAMVSVPVVYTPGTAITNGTVNRAVYTRVGQWLQGEVSVTYTGAGSLAVTPAQLIPSGLTLDTSAMARMTADSYNDVTVGTYIAVDTAAQEYHGVLVYNSTNIIPRAATGASALFTPGNLDGFSYTFRLPIAEWAGSGVVNLASGESMGSPFVYTFTDWNPSGTGDVNDAPSAGAVSSSNVDIGAALASGTLTATINRAGYYLATASLRHTHANAYGAARLYVTIGGTATNYGDTTGGSRRCISTGIDAQDSDEMVSLSWIVRVSAAGQTVTFKPEYNSNGISTPSQHTASAAFMLQPLSAIGQAIGYGDATPNSSGLMNTGTQTISGLKTITHGIVGGTSSPSYQATFTNFDTTGVDTLVVDTSGGSVTVKGFTGGVAGRRIYVIKKNSANSLTFSYNDGAADVGNRILTPGAINKTIGAGYGGAAFIYTGSDWTLISQ